MRMTEKQIKILESRIPNIKNLRGEVSEVIPIDSCADFAKIMREHRLEVKESAIYAFQNVSMHTDSISPKNYGTIIGVIKGSGILSYFKNSADYKKKKVSELTIRKGMVVYFDDKLPHSFVLEEKVKWCICCLANVKKKQAQPFFTN